MNSGHLAMLIFVIVHLLVVPLPEKGWRRWATAALYVAIFYHAITV